MLKSAFRFIFLGLGLAVVSRAGIIASGTDTVDGTESLTSTLRLFRNGIPDTWASPEAFPGTTSCGGNCFFDVLLFTPDSPFVQITYSLDSGDAANIFASAYVNGFDATNLSTNYLGDAGNSVAVSGPGPVVFQVIVPAGQQLALVFNSVGAGSFGTVDFTVETLAPEPAVMGLVGAGLAGLALLRRRAAK